ncbi:ornithine cyclodeaminase [Labrys miyagiensis]
MQIFDSEDVHRLLDYPALVGALRAAHAADKMPRSDGRVMDEPPAGENKFVSLVAWAAGDVIAVKLVGVFPSNLSLSQPEPSVQGLVALFNGKTGAPLLACDGAAMTFRKTAADSALGAALLSREDAEVLLVVGAGGLAPHVAMAHSSVRPSIKDIRIWNRTGERAEEAAAALRAKGYPARATTDLDTSVAEADIISCVTMAKKPLIRGGLLKPGAHVDLVGAYLPDMREADDDVVRRARVFVDTRVGCDHSGEIADPIARGLITLDAIQGDLFDLCTGRRPGRRSPEEITMYKNVGGGHLDLFTARHLMDAAGK